MSNHNDGHLLKAATELVEAMNKAADEHLPGTLAGIVKTHSVLAVGAALIPVPGADIAAAGANIWTMYVRISRELNLPFSENVIKSVGVGVATNLGGLVAGTLFLGSMFKIFPGLGSLAGAAIAGGTIYGVTIASGIVYMKAIAKLLRANGTRPPSDAELKAATDEVLRDAAEIKRDIDEASASYKKTGT